MPKVAKFLCLLFLIHLAYGDEDDRPSDEKVYDNYRLPTAITPENYKLEVVTHLNDTEGFVFRGIVWIMVRNVLLFCHVQP